MLIDVVLARFIGLHRALGRICNRWLAMQNELDPMQMILRLIPCRRKLDECLVDLQPKHIFQIRVHKAFASPARGCSAEDCLLREVLKTVNKAFISQDYDNVCHGHQI